MNKNKKTRPDAATSRRVKVEREDSASLSVHDYNTAAKDRQAGFFESILPHGAENAIPARQLVTLANLSSIRVLQKEIEYERRKGALILSKDGNGGGYFMPDYDREKGRREIAEFVKTNRTKAISTLTTIKTASDYLKGKKDNAKE